MKLYQLHRTHKAGTSVGFEYFSSQREARQAQNEWIREEKFEHGASIEMIKVSLTKKGILQAFNRYANHPDNG